MRSNTRRYLDIIAINLPIISYIVVIGGLYSVIRPQDWLNPETSTGILTMLITLVMSIPVIASSLVPALIRRDTDQEVAVNLYYELEGVKKSLCRNGNCEHNCISPLHHKVFDSLVSSGMINHVDPKRVYEVEEVYWMIKDYNEKYAGMCQSEHGGAESQKDSGCRDDSGEQQCQSEHGGAESQKDSGCRDDSGEQPCQSKDSKVCSRKDYEKCLKRRIEDICGKLKKNTKDR